MPNPTTFNVGPIAGVTVFLADGESEALVESMTQGEGPIARLKLAFPWNTRYNLLKALAGSAVLVGGKIVRSPPWTYPPSPNLVCVGVDRIVGIKAGTDATGFVTFQEAVIDCVFGYPRWQIQKGSPNGSNDPSGQPYTITTFKTSGEVFTPRQGTYVWGTGAPSKIVGTEVDNASVGIIRPRTEISMKRVLCPYVPLNVVETYIGTVNQNPIAFSDNTYPQGTVLFAGCTATPTADVLGDPVWDIEYTMLANGLSLDWNAFLAPDGNYYLINTKSDLSGQYPFSYQDWYSQLP
jgi:hypothetical protein